MDGFRIEEVEAASRKKQEASWSRLRVHSRHRRSKSASDKNLNISRDGVLHSVKKQQNEIHASQIRTKAYRPPQSPQHGLSGYVNKNASENQKASLEKDIELLQLRLQQERSMRTMLERTMGRASSTLSPGHRHFAKTKELIAEIESLEEEVVSREQHVLSLYRNVFEQCVSRPPSEQNSGMASPAHTKQGSRKHPSIISSAFCSSKGFPLRPLQALVAINDLGKKNLKTNDAADAPPFCFGKHGTPFDKTKTHEKIQVMEKAAKMRTLKDHLYQCPSKLSEEMVRCISAVYCWLRSATSVHPENNRSPILSRSSTNVVLPRRGTGEDQDFSNKSEVEISHISTDKSHVSCASYAISNYRALVEQLEKVTLNQMENNAQTAFWINVYNSLVMHAYLAYGIPHGPLRRLALFHKAAYNIGGHTISASAIEQSVFCFRTPRVGRWLENLLSTTLWKKSGEERQQISAKFGLPYSQPLVCFALCTGAFSDPVLKVYTAANVKDDLEAAKRVFLQANVVVKKSKKVFLPRVLERFARESSMNSDTLLKWVTENVDKKLHDSIQKCIDHHKSKNKKPSHIVEWLPYSSRFRYVFSKDLTEKPWWI